MLLHHSVYTFLVYKLCVCVYVLVDLSGEESVVLTEVLLLRHRLLQPPLQLPDVLFLLVHLHKHVHTCIRVVAMCVYTCSCNVRVYM